MNFSEVLNDYMKTLNITGKELSLKSGIPAPTISGYKNGNKEPKYNSDTLEKLINVVYEISKEKKIKIKEDEIKDNLEKYLIKNNIDFDIFRTNLNILIETLNINVSDLSKYIGFDSSYISKIRSGLRKPFNISDFAEGITKYVINNYYDDKTTIDNLISSTSLDELSLKNNLYTWLTNNKLISKSDYKIDNFFKKLDDFDLNNYIKAIKFDKLIVPTLPKILFKTKKYYGIDGYRDSQLEVLKQITFSKNPGDIFWYSDMPMEKISKDLKFTKRYMMYIAFVLKKGFTLNIIHDVNRPFNELMLGLEGWIPLYMTGQIKPYYFKSAPMSIYEHIECVGDASILHGEGVKGHIE